MGVFVGHCQAELVAAFGSGADISTNSSTHISRVLLDVVYRSRFVFWLVHGI